MKAFVLAVSVVVATAALPASAEIMTIGSTLAEGCFKSAKVHEPTFYALQTCDRALAEETLSHDDELATYVNRGILRMFRKDFDEARADFDRAINMEPGRAEPWLNLAMLHLRQRDARGALPLFDKALALKTDKPEIAYYGRALANEDLGNVKAAYADLKRAASLKPEWSAPAQDLARFRVRSR
jgi:tetratricopeptide (TPR) repeat protein